MEIIGHRGAAGHAPENTATAIAAGLRAGATAIGLDIQFTRDGVPVVFHDRDLDKAAGVKGRIRDQSARELSGYDIGFRRGNPYRGLRLLTLEEAAMQIPTGVDLHLALADFDALTGRHVKELLDVVKRRGGLERTLFASESGKALAAVRSAEPRARIGLWTAGAPGERIEEAAGLGCEALLADASRISPGEISKARDAGVSLIAYGADDPKLIRKLIDLGVNGLCSSYPDRVIEITGPVKPRPASSRRPSAQAPAAAPGKAAAASGAAADRGDAPEDASKTKKRRRGRRGGRKVRARREAQATEQRPKEQAGERLETEAVAEPVLEPVDEPAPGPEAARPAETETAAADAPAADGAKPAAKRRRRGHRGGKRHRLRRMRKQGVLPAEENAEPEPETESEPEQD